MKLQVRPSNVSGTVSAPPSKSYTHRAMVLAALAKGGSKLSNVLLSEDTLATLKGVEALGAIVNAEGGEVSVRGGTLRAPTAEIDCRNSGTSIRLLAGVASLLPYNVTLTGDASLQSRPMKPLLNALNELGVKATSARGDGMAPLIIRGPNKGRWAHIKGDVSSQFISSLLISSALKERDTDIVITTPLKSKPYVDITVDMMSEFGAKVYELKSGYRVMGGQSYHSLDYAIPGDYSSAAFPLVAGALTGDVTVTGLDPGDPQGDRRILEIMGDFGAKVKRTGDAVAVEKGPLTANDVNMGDCPDLFPIVAVLATQAEGTTRLTGAEHLKFKESDRIAAVASFLKNMGANIEATNDGCVINGPSKLKGKGIGPQGDHRILMSAAVAALVAEGPTTITDGSCYEVSYPKFLEHLKALGADAEASG